MELNDEKIWLYGLMVACPEGDPLVHCPIEQYRKNSIAERLFALENFTEEKVETIINHHHQCVLQRV